MKSKHLDKLRDLYIEENKRKYPSIPDHCRAVPKFSDKTANGLEKAIVLFLKLSGHQSERIKNTGRMLDNTKSYTDTMGVSRMIGSKQYIKGTGTNGSADISSTIQGRSVKIEVKIGKDFQSEAQKAYEQSVISAGGQYWIAKDFDTFYFLYESFIDYLKTH
jgi:hypothetical protein